MGRLKYPKADIQSTHIYDFYYWKESRIKSREILYFLHCKEDKKSKIGKKQSEILLRNVTYVGTWKIRNKKLKEEKIDCIFFRWIFSV